MVTYENTLSKGECFVLTALSTDNDIKTKQRSAVLLAWSHGSSNRDIARTTEIQVRRVKKLIRAFAQRRLEVFPQAKVALASRGIAGMTCVDSLVKRYAGDLTHSRYVAKLAVQIFDETASIHQVPLNYRRLLATGALLHDTGRNSGVTHKAQGSQIGLSYVLDGYSPIERDMVACLVLFQQKKLHAYREPVFTELDEIRQNITLALAAILRIAHGLDDSHMQSTVIDAIHVNGSAELETHGPFAASDAKRATRQAALWQKTMRVSFQVRAEAHSKTCEDAPIPIVINSSEPIALAGKKIVRVESAQLESLARLVRKNGAPDQIRKLRKTTQRLHTAVIGLSQYYPRKRTRAVRKSLGILSDALGRVHDFDVIQQDVQAYEQQTQVEQLNADLVTRRADAFHELIKFLSSAAFEELNSRLENLVNAEIEIQTPSVSAVIPTLLWQDYAAVRQFESHLDLQNGHTLHDLRRATKRLRYTLELFCEPLFATNSQIAEPLLALQKHLGQLHDAETSIRILQDLYGKELHHVHISKDEHENPELPVDYLAAVESRRQKSAATFGGHFQTVLNIPFRSALAALTAQF